MAKLKDFPRGDARRLMVVLLAVERLQSQATIYYIAQEIDCTRSEVLRALEAAARQFGIVFRKDGSQYTISSWGVLNTREVGELVAKG